MVKKLGLFVATPRHIDGMPSTLVVPSVILIVHHLCGSNSPIPKKKIDTHLIYWGFSGSGHLARLNGCDGVFTRVSHFIFQGGGAPPGSVD
jgi:hypothetical protein